MACGGVGLNSWTVSVLFPDPGAAERLGRQLSDDIMTGFPTRLMNPEYATAGYGWRWGKLGLEWADCGGV